MVLLIIIPFLNGYFIGNLPNIFRQTHGWKPSLDMFHKYGQQLRFGLQRESLVSGWDLRVPSTGFSGWRQNMGMSQNVRPGPQIFLSIFSIHHPTIGVLNFDPYGNFQKWSSPGTRTASWLQVTTCPLQPDGALHGGLQDHVLESWNTWHRGAMWPSHPLSLSSQDISSWMTL